MKLHVLPGDAVAERFPREQIEGEIAVCREVLVEGPIKAADISAFWSLRAEYLTGSYPESPLDYYENVAAEFEKLRAAKEGDEVMLWFENELFCQANLWSCLALAGDSHADVYRVSPQPDDKWHFGNDLVSCFEDRVLLTGDDKDLGENLWRAFADGDNDELIELGKVRSPAFPYLDEVTRAAAVRDTRPAEVVRSILADGHRQMPDILREFSLRAGEYGYGDAQLQKIIDAEIS